jgi:hypothetical protein
LQKDLSSLTSSAPDRGLTAEKGKIADLIATCSELAKSPTPIVKVTARRLLPILTAWKDELDTGIDSAPQS